MATNNSVNTGLAGATGSGNFVGANTPTLITPNIGAATSSGITFSPTTSGISGVTDASSAAAGKVGQIISNVIPFASAVALTSTVVTDMTQISLTAGDWLVWGNVTFIPGAAVTTETGAWLSATSATLPDYSLVSLDQVAAMAAWSLSPPTLQFNVNSTTIVYLTVVAIFPSSTNSACGGLYAMRRR